MAIESPSRPDKLGPMETFARYFKGSPRKERSSEEDDLSRILRQTHIASTPPKKALPDLPPARTPSQFQHQRTNRLPHSVSLHHYPPGNQPCTPPRQTAGQSRQHAGRSSLQPDSLPHMPMPIPNPYMQRIQPHSVDHLAVAKMPNPWELEAPVPASSLPPAFLTPTRPIRPMSAPVSALTKKTARRSKTIVVGPLQLPGIYQCWGIKRDGTRCTRKVGSASTSPSKRRTPSKSPSPSKGRVGAAKGGGKRESAIIVSDSDEDSSQSCSEDDARPEYCHQHSKEINKTNGFVLPGLRRIGSTGRAMTFERDETYVDFGKILGGLVSKGGQEEENCKAKLRTAMCQSPSEVDWVERGYIYIYELRDRFTDTHIALKVGRAINVYKRLEQWRSQCQSKDPLLRVYFPRRKGVTQDVLPGAASVTEQGALLSHKWEKLIHIELSYLGKRLDDKCNDCGSRHREIFLIPRQVGYEGVVRAVERWLSFVKLVTIDGMGGQQEP